MDVRAENRGRPHQKCVFLMGEILFDPWAFGRKGQIRTKKFMFMLFFLPSLIGKFLKIREGQERTNKDGQVQIGKPSRLEVVYRPLRMESP